MKWLTNKTMKTLVEVIFVYKYTKSCGIVSVTYITETTGASDSITTQTIVSQKACIVNW